jgi:hypothetical protein
MTPTFTRPLALLALTLLASCGGSHNSSTGGGLTFTPVTGTVLPATAGVPFTQTFTVVSGGSPPYTFVATNTPGGLSLAAATVNTGLNGTLSATLSGTPPVNAQGLETFTMTVTDAKMASQSYTWIIEVAQATPALTVTPATLPTATRGQPYNVFLRASGGTAPFNWAVSGTLPPGLTFQPSNTLSFQLSGTPTTAGSFSFSVTVVDGSTPARSTILNFTMTIS